MNEEHRSARVVSFLNEVAELCKKHNVCIAPESKYDSLIVRDYSDWDMDGLMMACDETRQRD